MTAHGLTEWALQTGLAVTVLVCFVLLIRKPFTKAFGAGATYALWALPFIRLFMPEVSIPRVLPQFFKRSPEIIPEPTAMVSTPEILDLMQPQNPSLVSEITPFILPSLLGLWILGAIFFFLYHWVRQATLLDRLIYGSEPAAKLHEEVLRAVGTVGLRRVPNVRISEGKAGPLVTGFFRPLVILPDNFMDDFNAEQRHFALMHEFMHIRRGDIWVTLAWLAFRAVNWPNPLVHYAVKRFRSDQEAACDASVLNIMGENNAIMAAYAETLIHAAKSAIIDGRESPHSSPLALTIHHPLKERLMILGTHRKISNWKSRMAAAVMIIGAATLSAPLIQADSHPEEELAGKNDGLSSYKTKSVIKFSSVDETENISKHYEISIDGDKVEAFEIDNAGRKTSIDPEQIEGFDLNAMKDGRAFAFNSLNGEDLKSMDNEEIVEWIKNNKSDESFSVIKFGSEGNNVVIGPNSDHKGDVTILSDQITVFNSDEILSDTSSLEGLETQELIEGVIQFEDLEGLDKNLQSLVGDVEGQLKLKLLVTESQLAATTSILEDTQVEIDDSREMAKAKRELENARKALKAAEQALQDAE